MLISLNESGSLGPGRGSAPTSLVENDAVTTQHGGDDVGIAREAPDCCGGQGRACRRDSDLGESTSRFGSTRFSGIGTRSWTVGELYETVTKQVVAGRYVENGTTRQAEAVE